MKNFYKKSQLGRSMVEMLGVLAIIGVLSVGGIAGYSKAMEKHKINKALEQVSLIIAQIRTTFSATQGYEGLTAYSDEIIKNAIGTEAAAADGGAVNGGFRLYGNKQYFEVALAGVGKAACIALVTANWGDSDSGLYEIDVLNQGGPGYAEFGSGQTDGNGLPPSMEAATNGCSCTESRCQITWYFH